MTARTLDAAPSTSSSVRPLWRTILAGVLQGASFFTTLWAVQWIWPEGQLSHQVFVGFIAEAALVGLKSLLFVGRRGDGVAGWIGFVIDAILNTDGLLPRADRLLTFGPIAAVLSLFGLNVSGLPMAVTITADGKPLEVTIGGLLVALLGGALLSILPHRLWRA
jgi:lipid-A-disaccharide synthase-like uncharacterized protein